MKPFFHRSFFRKRFLKGFKERFTKEHHTLYAKMNNEKQSTIRELVGGRGYYERREIEGT